MERAGTICCIADKAPVSKSLMVYIGCSHAATHVPAFAPFFRKMFTGCKKKNIFVGFQYCFFQNP